MKRAISGIVLVGTFLSAVTAFAQSAPSDLPANSRPAIQAPQVALNTVSAASEGSHQVAPYDQPALGKTRAQVYRELVHAERDGQLARLNSTVYAHP
ncbi:uncharacterized protein DUF4148 [Paraburkholderia sp. BL6669N2]|uniref:DUF4148 domain-containing protein n=1 Tax=Paraburkholderia sp. BL6669N2 TaxID=1938807 RepID=UPI000E27A37A|nr:DUF4148 domain-containing protein [Paraburkholderia sp. BL6669N2]REG52157.1 uncharacterized protein DUF4148 [Paraburkholderia sp. BL6669N2]